MDYKNLPKLSKITFITQSNFTGEDLQLDGIILGSGDAVRKFWPIEAGEAPDDCYLVKVKDVYGNVTHHAIVPEQILGAKDKAKKED